MRRAFLYADGAGMADLGTLGGRDSVAYAINGAGQVVGTADTRSEGKRAFLWSPGGGMVDLNGLIDRAAGWVLTQARGINDTGQIVGQGLHNGQPRAFRLTRR